MRRLLGWRLAPVFSVAALFLMGAGTAQAWSITGTPEVGQTLYANIPSTLCEDTHYPGIGYSCGTLAWEKWYRSPYTYLGAGSSYVPTTSDVGSQIWVWAEYVFNGTLYQPYNSDNFGPITAPAVTSQSITFTAPTGLTYGNSDSSLGATASSGLPVSYTSETTGVCTIVSGKLHVVSAGSCGIDANQAGGTSGSTTYSAAPQVQQTFAIAKATMHVDASAAAKTYGQSDPSASDSLRSADLVNGDTSVAGVSGAASCSIGTHSQNANSYAGVVTCLPGTLSSTNYSFVQGSAAGLTVNKAVVRVDANPVSRAYGQSDGAASDTLRSGDFRYSDSASSSGITGAASCSIGSHSPDAGMYPGVVSCQPGSLSSQNYSFTAGSGADLTIGKASQTVQFTSSAPASATAGSGSYRPSASAASGLPVSISLDASSTGCALSGGVVSFTGAGTCVIDADQAGSIDYLAATQIQQRIGVAASLASLSVAGSPEQGQKVWVTGQQSGVSYSYQWETCDGSGAHCQAIPGATGTSYTLTDSDLGRVVRVVISSGGHSSSPVAGSGAMVAPAAPAWAIAHAVGSAESATGTASATLRGVTVSGSGAGSLTLSQAASNPIGSALWGSTGGFFGVEVTPGSNITGLKITDSHLNGGRRLMAWNGHAWVELPGQSYSAGPPPSVTVSIPAGSPLLKLPELVIGAAQPENQLVPRPTPVAHRDGTFTIPVKVPRPGRVDVMITAWNDNVAHTVRLLQPAARRFVFARALARAKKKGTILVTVHPNARGQQLLARHTYRPTFRLWITYTPVGGRAHSIGYYGIHLPN